MITRIITALLALPVFLFFIYMGDFYIFVFISALVFLAIYELYRMMEIEDKHYLWLLELYLFLVFLLEGLSSSFMMVFLFAFTIFALYLQKYSKDMDHNKKQLNNVFKSIFIFSYLIIPLSYILKIRALENGFYYLLFMFLIIWSTDSMAYFVGRAIGKNKLSPFISPNKTIEGAIGGSLSAVLITLLINKYLNIFPEFSPLFLAIIILFLTLCSQIGDLFESSLKRLYNVKDSGKIFPGHGGVLDRFDSTIFVAPIYYLIIIFLIS